MMQVNLWAIRFPREYDWGMATEDPGPAETVRWLDEDEMRTWMVFAPLLFRLPLELDRQLQRDSGMSLIEYLVMAGLCDSPDHSLTMTTLASWSGAQLPRLSQVAARMQARGWITRAPDPHDGRSTRITLTDKGFEVQAAAAPGHVARVRELVIDPLTRGQIGALGAASARMIDALEPKG